MHDSISYNSYTNSLGLHLKGDEMKLNMMTVLKDRDGVPMLKAQGGEPVTLRWICCEALEGFHEEDKGLSGEEKFKRGQLVMKLYSSEEPDLTVEELTMIKQRIGKGFNVPVVREVFSLITEAGG